MKRLFILLFATFGIVFGLVAAPRVQACPMCGTALESTSGGEEDDPMREAKAYSASIYLMAGMPYLLLGGLGGMFYHSVKSARRAEQLEDGKSDNNEAPNAH